MSSDEVVTEELGDVQLLDTTFDATFVDGADRVEMKGADFVASPTHAILFGLITAHGTRAASVRIGTRIHKIEATDDDSGDFMSEDLQPFDTRRETQTISRAALGEVVRWCGLYLSGETCGVRVGREMSRYASVKRDAIIEINKATAPDAWSMEVIEGVEFYSLKQAK